MKGQLVVYGAGGHGKVVAEVARSAGYEVIGFIDDRPDARGPVVGLPVHGSTWITSRALRGAACGLGVGDPLARQRIAARVAAEGLALPTLIHATASVASTARLGAGTVVMPMVVVNPDAIIGDGVILNSGCVVEHDCRVAHFAHLSPHAALGGAVHVGERSHLGLGAVAIPGVHIGDDVVVGAGAAVIRDVEDGVTVVGVPARPVHHPVKRSYA